MKEIPLTKGKVALVDDADYEWLSQWKWRAILCNRVWYAIRGRTTKNKMHNDILPPSPGMEIDHKDGDGLNNQRSNLREVTHQQNIWN